MDSCDTLMDIDTIIDGIIAGLVSTCIMTIYEIPFWRIWGIKGILEWHENQILTSKLLKGISKTKSYTGTYAGILLLHIINGTLAGIIFPFIYLIFISFFSQAFQLSTILGIIFGILLWLLTLLPIHKPITGLPVWNHPLGKGPAIISFCGHVLYGFTLGTVTNTLFLHR
jgi:hypothetical protein